MIDKKNKRDIISFLSDLTADFSGENLGFIVVSHLVDNTLDFIKALSIRGEIIGFIAKPNSIDQKAKEKMISSGIKILDVRRQNLFSDFLFRVKIKPLLKGKKVIIFDTGGYFAPVLEKMNDISEILGIVEDTENGLQKYEHVLKEYKQNRVPIFSIARSRTKDFEDYLVGRSIACSTIRILRDNNETIQDKSFGIIGFGEVGRGCAFYLQEKLKTEVHIYDHNPELQDKIIKSGCFYSSKDALLKTSDGLICATGNKSLNEEDLKNLKQGCCISSCTSFDDEFDIDPKIQDNFRLSGKHIHSFKSIFFLNKGNAVNFTYPETQADMVFPYIYLTFSSLIKCALKIKSENIDNLLQVNTITKKEEKELISSFLKKIRGNNANVQFIEQVMSKKLWKGN